VGDAGGGLAGVAIVRRNVRVDAVQQEFKALGGIPQAS